MKRWIKRRETMEPSNFVALSRFRRVPHTKRHTGSNGVPIGQSFQTGSFGTRDPNGDEWES